MFIRGILNYRINWNKAETVKWEFPKWDMISILRTVTISNNLIAEQLLKTWIKSGLISNLTGVTNKLSLGLENKRTNSMNIT